MISHQRLCRILEQEREKLATEEGYKTDFVRGLIQGLRLASALAKDLWNKTKNDLHQNPMGSRKTFLRVICTAHDQIARGERSRGLETLHKAIVKAERR